MKISIEVDDYPAVAAADEETVKGRASIRLAQLETEVRQWEQVQQHAAVRHAEALHQLRIIEEIVGS